MTLDEIRNTPLGQRIVALYSPEASERLLEELKIASGETEVNFSQPDISGSFLFSETPQGHSFWWDEVFAPKYKEWEQQEEEGEED